PQPAADAISDDRSTRLARDREGETKSFGVIFEKGQRERSTTKSHAIGPQRHETGPVGDAVDQADSLARPFGRRPRRPSRPSTVDMRARKPWYLALRRTFG